ncbi:alpha/beta-hydrolase, partial [Thozetella sp. PMI_491]
GTIDEGPFSEDLNGSNFTYPWPVKLYKFRSQHQDLEMAFMDVPPASCSTPNNKTAVLFHGKNFCGPTWEATARELLNRGYRVVLPDQIGFCKSTKPAAYQFSLAQFAYNVNNLLTVLNVSTATIIGHSMGGMLAARYGLLYPDKIDDLVMVDPLGLEDWRSLGEPYLSIDDIYVTEHASNYTTIRTYEQATYYVGQWDPSYDVWVNMLVNIYKGSQGEAFAFNQALTTDMVLSQPVVYEFPLLKTRTLLIIGDKDNTAIGKAWSPPEVQAKMGHYDVLGKQAAAAIPNCTLVEFPDLGHSPQIQAPDRFYEALFGWLS